MTPEPKSDLLSRLEARLLIDSVTLHRGDLWNIDGPEAAEAIRVLAKALEPFASSAEKLDGLWAADDWRWNDSTRSNVTVGDLRAAQAALLSLNKEGKS